MKTATDYTIGDKVVIKANGNTSKVTHGFTKGEVVIITKLFPDHYRADSATDYWWVDDQDIFGRATL